MLNYIVDCETLDLRDTAIIPAVSIATVDSTLSLTDNLRKYPVITIHPSVPEQFKLGRTTSPDTLSFWNAQDRQVRDEVMDQTKAMPVEQALSDIRSALAADASAFIWQRGSRDADWLNSLAASVHTEALIPYHRVREIRTAIDVLGLSTKMNGYIDPDKVVPEAIEIIETISAVTGGKHNPVFDCVRDLCALRSAGLV